MRGVTVNFGETDGRAARGTLIVFAVAALLAAWLALRSPHASHDPAFAAALENSERGQGAITANVDVAPAALLRTPPGADWPSYNGDYTGRRYSALDQVTPANVHGLRGQWV